MNVLITRPEKEGRVLANKLKNMDVDTYCQPMFDYQLNNTKVNLLHLFTQVNQPILIFVSVASVVYANKISPIATWPASQIFAVGKATLQALQTLNVDAVAPSLQNSEGILSLAELQTIEEQSVIIVRGDGGREYLAETLKSRKAIVYYFETYQRIWRQLASNVVQHWRSNNVNCIVITSDALLQSVVELVQLMNQSDSCADNYWQNTCTWVVASERIAEKARAIGLINVVNAQGASDNAISEAISLML